MAALLQHLHDIPSPKLNLVLPHMHMHTLPLSLLYALPPPTGKFTALT